MKKTAFLFVLLLIGSFCQAQTIHQISIYPPVPSENEQIRIIADMSFSSGPCNDHQQQFNINGNNIYASAMHCLGMLSVICNYADTFAIGTLPQGNYRFYFDVNNGFGPSPCSPGIVPGPMDSLVFTVTAPAAIKEMNDEATTVQYLQGSNKIMIHFTSPVSSGKACLYNATGQILQKINLKGNQQSMATNGLPEGLYILELSSEQGRLTKRLLLRN